MRAAMVLLQSFNRMVSAASIIQNKGAPIVMYPLILGAQVVNVAVPGHEPDLDKLDMADDVRLLAPRLTDSSGNAPASESERRAYFSKDANRQVCTDATNRMRTYLSTEMSRQPISISCCWTALLIICRDEVYFDMARQVPVHDFGPSLVFPSSRCSNPPHPFDRC